MTIAQLGPLLEPGPIEYLDPTLFKTPQDTGELVTAAADRAGELGAELEPLRPMLLEVNDEVAAQRERLLWQEQELLWTSTKFYRVPLADSIGGIYDEMGSDKGNSAGIGRPDVPTHIGGLPTDNLENDVQNEQRRNRDEIERRERQAPRWNDEEGRPE